MTGPARVVPDGGGRGTERSLLSRLGRLLRTEAKALQPRVLLAEALTRPVPYGHLGVLRVATLRAVGFSGIDPKVRFHGPITLRGGGPIHERLWIGAGTTINSPCLIELNATVRIGERVGIGHHVVIITSGHAIGPPGERRGPIVPSPVSIGDGAWIGARAMLMPGVSVGTGAVVGAGTLVTRNVPRHAVVAGVPARVVRRLENAPPSPEETPTMAHRA